MSQVEWSGGGRKPPVSERTVVPLDEVLAYQHPQVVQRFLNLYDLDLDEAEDLFRETLRFLWACASSSQSLAPTTILDKMWHNFILFTADYAAFCHEHFSYFIAHYPADKVQRAARRERDPESFRYQVERERQQQIVHLYQLLGEETVLRWYVEHAVRYDGKFFRERSLQPDIPDLSLDDMDPFLVSRLKALHDR